MNEFYAGQDVIYEGNETFIEIIYVDETCLIKNPDWSYEDEAVYCNEGIEYPVDFWTRVALRLITPAPKPPATTPEPHESQSGTTMDSKATSTSVSVVRKRGAKRLQ